MCDISEVEREKNKLLLSISQLFNEACNVLQQRKSALTKEVSDVYEPQFTNLQNLREIKEIDVAVLSSSIQSAADSITKVSVITYGNILAF